MTGHRMTDLFGQVRSRSRQLAVMVAVTVIGYMTGSCGHGHASADDSFQVKVRSCTGRGQCEQCIEEVCTLLHFETRVRSETQRGDNGLGAASQSSLMPTGAPCDIGGPLLTIRCPLAFVPICTA
jgi:hypothetical protein